MRKRNQFKICRDVSEIGEAVDSDDDHALTRKSRVDGDKRRRKSESSGMRCTGDVSKGVFQEHPQASFAVQVMVENDGDGKFGVRGVVDGMIEARPRTQMQGNSASRRGWRETQREMSEDEQGRKRRKLLSA